MKWLKIPFVIVLVCGGSLPSRAADLISELTGEAARRRTAEARSRRDEVRAQVQALLPQVQGRAAELQAKRKALLKQKKALSDAQVALLKHLEKEMQRLNEEAKKHETLRASLVQQLDWGASLEKLYLDFSEVAQRTSSTVEAMNRIRETLRGLREDRQLWLRALSDVTHQLSQKQKEALDQLVQAVGKDGGTLQSGSENAVTSAISEFLSQVNSDSLMEAARQMSTVKGYLRTQLDTLNYIMDGNQKIIAQYQKITATLTKTL